MAETQVVYSLYFLDKMVSEINSQQDQPFTLQIVEGAEGISEFGEHWDDLFARAVDAPPYLSRPWVSTFIREGRIKGTPLFILAWCGTKLVALFPLAVRKYLTAKMAEPISTSQASYLGLLIDPDYRSVTKDIADIITSKRVFDVYFSADLSSEDTATRDLLDELVQKGYVRHQAFRNPCFYIELDCSFDEYFTKKASSKSRQNLRRRERRLFESGNVKVEHYAGKEVTPEALLRIAAIEEQSWLKRRGAAKLQGPFYQKLLLEMAQAGFGHVWLMTIDDIDAAFEYVFVSHKKLLFEWRAFDLKFASSVSIGQILMMHTIRDACSTGILSMDISHGEADYKRFWAEACHSVYRVVAGRGLCGYLIATLFYAAVKIARIKWLKSFYRRIRRVLHGFSRKTANV
jgi:CelD/BcsL family acetyltransferase involved in cellulose biosynthesis